VQEMQLRDAADAVSPTNICLVSVYPPCVIGMGFPFLAQLEKSVPTMALLYVLQRGYRTAAGGYCEAYPKLQRGA
jgi:hypothetical protein